MKSFRTMGLVAVAFALTGALTGGIAQAHTGLPGHAHGFGDGVLHPLSGLDHMAAMVAVGVWAASLGARAVWAVPASFVALLTVGAALGVGIGAPGFVEPAIAASVVVLGVLVAADLRLPVLPAAALVGVFAIFHGLAHGAEMPALAAPLAYGAGFVVATASLHLTGIGAGVALSRLSGHAVTRLAGALTAAFGLTLAFGV